MHLNFKVANRRSLNFVEAVGKDLWKEEQLAYIPFNNCVDIGEDNMTCNDRYEPLFM